MSVREGTGVSIGTFGWVVEETLDITAPDKANFTIASATATTAHFNLTLPKDLDYDHCTAYVYEEGGSTEILMSPFIGALSDLTPGTWYIVTVCAFDGADDATANRSKPSPPRRFRTLTAAEGTYNFLLGFRTDEAIADEAAQRCNLQLDEHRFPIGLRGVKGQLRVELDEVGQDILWLGWEADAKVLGRRRD